MEHMYCAKSVSKYLGMKRRRKRNINLRAIHRGHQPSKHIEITTHLNIKRSLPI